MAIEVRKRENETASSMLYRFSKRVQHGGVVKEARKRQFTTRTANSTKRRAAALYRIERQTELQKTKKRGK
ncbi:MAG: 30S ribosomal protein S21 [bacterium]|nr:30S ribosomal protein S21 [Candidatus Jorgensenbacteria bacterium]